MTALASAQTQHALRLAPAATAALALLVVGAFIGAVATPLAAYTTTLALFGLAHVLYELRYVAWRFGPRLRGAWLPALFGLIACAVAARLASQLRLVDPRLTTAVELACGAALALLPVYAMRSRRVVGALLALPFALGAVVAPFETLLALAILHNLTPLAFLADILPAGRRAGALALAAGLFILVPLVIATGWPADALAALGLDAPEASLFRAGGLDDNLGAYIPDRFIDHPRALDVFSAAVFAQCMHYLAVIWLLPRLMRAQATPTAAPLMTRGVFALAVALASAALIGAYAMDYGLARKIYALMALVHAWLEIPVLLLALDRTGVSPTSPPPPA